MQASDEYIVIYETLYRLERKIDIVRELLINDIEKKIKKSSGRHTFYGVDAQCSSDDCFCSC